MPGRGQGGNAANTLKSEKSAVAQQGAPGQGLNLGERWFKPSTSLRSKLLQAPTPLDADDKGEAWSMWPFCYIFLFVFFYIRSGRLILIVGCGRAQRRTATFLLRQPGGGGGHVPVPARPGRGGREEGAGHRADREDRPRGVWPLPCTDHRLCRQGEKKLTD